MPAALRTTTFIGGMLLSLLLPSAAAAQAPLPAPDHIVILIEENSAYSEVIGSASAPHINALAAMPHAAVFTHFFALEHPSQPNYLDLFSGYDQAVDNDNPPLGYPFTTPNLCAELMSGGRSFKTYSEDLPSVGYDGSFNKRNGANYARKHNPCANWVGSGKNQFSDTVNQPFTAFPSLAVGSVGYAALPTVSFVVPNLDNDMHNGDCNSNPCPRSIARADAWMYNNLSSLWEWALSHNTLFILVCDEDDDFHGNNIPVVFYGPMVKGGTYSEKVNHFNLLNTIESMYGLTHAGHAASVTPITDCWIK